MSTPVLAVAEEEMLPSPRSSKRTSQKVIAAADLARRKLYAQEWFDTINREVFDSGLPETTLLWNISD